MASRSERPILACKSGFLHLLLVPLLCESDFSREFFPSAILELRVVGVGRFHLKDRISLSYSSLSKENGI